MLQTAHGWELEVERGPDWLFVRPHDLPQNAFHGEAEMAELAEEVLILLEQNFSRRLVLELDQMRRLNSSLIGQLVKLYKRIVAQGGMMRITGLSTDNRRLLDECRLTGRFPCYSSRTDAVMGVRPHQPR